MRRLSITVPKEKLAKFCRANHIRRLALFGSVLREDFGPDSDVDVLVEFDPEHVPGLFGVSRLARDLSSLFGGRHVDLRTAEDLSRYFRAQVVATAEVQYAKGRQDPPATHVGRRQGRGFLRSWPTTRGP